MSGNQQDHRIDDEPTEERKAELEAAYQQNIVQDKAPYDGVKVATYGELLWVFEQRQWSGDLYVDYPPNFLPEGKQRPNLRGAYLESVNLSGAVLQRATLSGANLFQTNLSGASLYQTNLSEARLVGANLSGAYMGEADLSGAYLGGAILNGAFLESANLSGVDLQRAKFDSDTDLAGVILSSMTALRDIRWNGVNLSPISWESVQRLGDDDREYPDDAARAYRQVATQLRSQGMNEVADRFAYLAQLWQRRILRQRLRWTNFRSLGPYLGSLLLWAISGYGYRPSRTFAAYLLVVGSFAAAYYAVTHTVETQLAKLSWDEALVLSLTSFHGRGFLPGFLALGDWVARIGALEAVIGLFIELILIATFSRRFLGN